MTFVEMVARVADRLNLTSDDAIIRIGEEINDRYNRVTTAIGMQTARRITVNASTVIDSQEVVFEDVEKILVVYTLFDTPRKYILDELTADEMLTITPPESDSPRRYAITRMGATTVTLKLDVLPQTVFSVYAEGYDMTDLLADDQVPAIPESFHDILVAGATADELLRMEKGALAKESEGRYESRLSDLRMFIAKSGYADIVQNKRPVNRPRWMYQN